MDKRAAIVLGVIFGGLFLALFGFLILAFSVAGGAGAGKLGAGNVGVVEVKGPITDAEDEVKALHDFLEEDRIKAVVVRVNSPGGAVGPSQEIHAEIRRLAEEKPVVVSMGDVAASGGYYLAVAADKIVANPGTLTGSIGVITQFPNVTAIAEKIGFQMNTVKSGAAKDIGNPFRPFTEADRKVFEGLVDDVYRQFVGAVVEGRKLPEEQVKAIADGRVLTGEQALQAGLIDQLGNFNDAVDLAAELAGIEGKPKLVYPEKEEPLSLHRLLRASVREGVRAVADELRLQLRSETSAAPRVEFRLPGT
ncbi:signal peptide peptidase SppA [Vulgatibacter incomptus]|uniref:Signal peptide peptidase SppA, 36K type n=1 Tax=Vulgatibacter incomptus TaxID=1391653 RepID=A0A0K1PBX3_9BACT|nr:signal peptide peptidase SppA [Vulgatibacter incomptus]AKU91038.1 signal peptide peptidase SppA, 36K type [Vulgatibacter incomptus]